MKNDATINLDWWMTQVYRSTKHFITQPSEESEKQLVSMLAEYRKYHDEHAAIRHTEDEHERLMDYL